jgi:hypothetical protein
MISKPIFGLNEEEIFFHTGSMLFVNNRLFYGPKAERIATFCHFLDFFV